MDYNSHKWINKWSVSKLILIFFFFLLRFECWLKILMHDGTERFCSDPLQRLTERRAGSVFIRDFLWGGAKEFPDVGSGSGSDSLWVLFRTRVFVWDHPQRKLEISRLGSSSGRVLTPVSSPQGSVLNHPKQSAEKPLTDVWIKYGDEIGWEPAL